MAAADRYDERSSHHVPDRPPRRPPCSTDVDAALGRPAATCRRPGELIVHEEAGAQVQAIASGASSSCAPPAAAAAGAAAVVALEPPTRGPTALIFANAGIIIMFIGIFSYGTWVLTGVVEEKQSRVVEVVLSTVRPRDLLMGKVIGIGLLALVQLVILVAAGIAAAQLSGPADAARDHAGA